MGEDGYRHSMCGIQIAKIKETENVAIDDTTREQNGQSSVGQYKTKWFRLTERSGNQLAGESNWRNLPNVAQYIFCDITNELRVYHF